MQGRLLCLFFGIYTFRNFLGFRACYEQIANAMLYIVKMVKLRARNPL